MSRTISISKRDGDVANREAMQRQLDCMLNTVANGNYTLTLAKRKSQRSLDQNALMWLWFTCIASETGSEKQDVHDHYCRQFLVKDIEFNGKQEKIIISTSKLNTAAMTEFLNKVQSDAASELGIRLPNPEDLHFNEFQEYYKSSYEYSNIYN